MSGFPNHTEPINQIDVTIVEALGFISFGGDLPQDFEYIFVPVITESYQFLPELDLSFGECGTTLTLESAEFLCIS